MEIVISARNYSVFFMSNNQNKNFQNAISISSTILGALFVFGILGYWLDNKFDSGNFWLIIGLGLGVFISLYELGKYIFK